MFFASKQYFPTVPLADITVANCGSNFAELLFNPVCEIFFSDTETKPLWFDAMSPPDSQGISPLQYSATEVLGVPPPTNSIKSSRLFSSQFSCASSTNQWRKMVSAMASRVLFWRSRRSILSSRLLRTEEMVFCSGSGGNSMQTDFREVNGLLMDGTPTCDSCCKSSCCPTEDLKK